MRLLFFTAAILFSLGLYAQDKTKEINEQVWKPFISSFEKNDINLFKSLHSPQLIRVQTNEMLNFETYMKGYTSMFADLQAKGRNYTIDLRFTRRVADSSRAYEEGFYKTSYVQEGKVRASYGRFTVVLLKTDANWKILLDSDTNAGATEAAFLEAKAME